VAAIQNHFAVNFALSIGPLDDAAGQTDDICMPRLPQPVWKIPIAIVHAGRWADAHSRQMTRVGLF
ncbi:hypothetical protein, partial [Mesorhizobium sp. M7A.F.Ca.CA.004.01.1.1]|uniref:hypothetical protein n=1 Tax=Mesorhizobium sp. M7A.F.Ca.CA.004.01.1.1 TaxID=2496689 RepID=UPI0019D24F80